MKTVDERFFAKVHMTSECWVWTACLNHDGYGKLRIKDRGMPLAHRIAYEATVGPVPAGLELDHLCRNRACVRPDHLEPVPHRVNVLRGESPAAGHSRKTTCPKGHPYDEKNTYWHAGWRHCRACGAANQRAYAARKMASQGDD